MSVASRVKRRLQRRTETPSLHTEYPLAHRRDPAKPIVFTLYSDNNRARMKDKLRDEKATITAIRNIFEIEEPAMWHWEYAQDYHGYVPPKGAN
ncbi:hypothetical protein BV25DRAFT_1830007 [Artomyces pyxidatus]|uniref:Uncharacterized protein n=1 Tax=Artomyces pyxidatus TaxID=48021 RepID=A0ACB8SQT2_9AGAM|nr:hypothetical protein BV25DRAFT_1830007 [Artomyces pyxidatus]